ncbi:MAG: 5-oxoprolinase subunit PxpA [Nitriliruptorales bacterium]|nr:5-oxoprolinase subunit PxpA [Nitriliruptorales bacterium]
MMRAVDFNADLGESFGLWERGADAALMEVISSANVACGFHAGDPSTIRTSVERAVARGVAVGAHPGFPDLLGFGRRALQVSEPVLRDYVIYQVGAVRQFAALAGVELHHVKPHGALYMMALEDLAYARAIAEATARIDERLLMYTLGGSALWDAASQAGLRPVSEFFADRPTRASGEVVMFQWWEEFEATPEAVAERARAAMVDGTVKTLEGVPLTVEADTVCVHSDTPRADELGRAVHRALESAGLTIRPHPQS